MKKLITLLVVMLTATLGMEVQASDWEAVHKEALRDFISLHRNVDEFDGLTVAELEEKADAIWEENHETMFDSLIPEGAYVEATATVRRMFLYRMMFALVFVTGFYVYFSNRDWKVIKSLKVVGSVAAIFGGAFLSWLSIVLWRFDRSMFECLTEFWMRAVLSASPWMFVFILGILGLFFGKKYTDLVGMMTTGAFLVLVLLMMITFDFTFYDFRVRQLLVYGIVMITFTIRFLKGKKILLQTEKSEPLMN